MMDTALPNLALHILDVLPACVYTKQRDGRYVYANRAMCTALGLSPLAIEGQTDNDLFLSRQIVKNQPESIDAHDTATQHQVELLTLRSGEQLTILTRVAHTHVRQ